MDKFEYRLITSEESTEHMDSLINEAKEEGWALLTDKQGYRSSGDTRPNCFVVVMFKKLPEFSKDTNRVTDVHTEHCCARCGCKYGDEDCTVVTGKLIQSYPCNGNCGDF